MNLLEKSALFLFDKLLLNGNTNKGDKMNKSIWDEYLKGQKFNKLDRDIETDVLIMGGGIVGLLTAHLLKDYNIDYCLVEKDAIGSGTTSKTTAFLTIQHETLYQTLTEKQRQAYLYINNKALHRYQQLSKIYNFDYEELDSCLYSKNHNLIKKEYEVLKKQGIGNW